MLNTKQLKFNLKNITAFTRKLFSTNEISLKRIFLHWTLEYIFIQLHKIHKYERLN